jgi:hypothetical protein
VLRYGDDISDESIRQNIPIAQWISELPSLRVCDLPGQSFEMATKIVSIIQFHFHKIDREVRAL